MAITLYRWQTGRENGDASPGNELIRYALNGRSKAPGP